MKFKDLLNEKFWKTARIYQKDLDFFIHPNKKEINEIIKNSKYREIRGGIHKNDVYTWDGGEVDHGSVRSQFNFRFTWTFIYRRKMSDIELYSIGNPTDRQTKNIENKLLKMFGASTII